MKKILVAEDDKFLANAYRIKLQKSGYEVKITTDGQETIDVLKEFVPDVILLDLVMPVKDGFAALSEIKKSETLKYIPVVIASNLGQKEDIERGMKLGASDFIVKTDLSLDKLINKLNSLATHV